MLQKRMRGFGRKGVSGKKNVSGEQGVSREKGVSRKGFSKGSERFKNIFEEGFLKKVSKKVKQIPTVFCFFTNWKVFKLETKVYKKVSKNV